jgi:hypothetical protein
LPCIFYQQSLKQRCFACVVVAGYDVELADIMQLKMVKTLEVFYFESG